MGLLRPQDWTARWITASQVAAPALPLFRREFWAGKTIKHAAISLCGLGQFELHVNGHRVGNDVLEPGWTNYRKTCLYVTYDLTNRLTPGRNTLGILLGNGMYHVQGQRYMKFEGSFGPPKLIAQLTLEFADGTRSRIVSDGAWQTASGPITLSGIFGNEDYDARLEQPGWDRVGFAPDARWRPAVVTQGPGGALCAEATEPIRVRQVLKPVAPPAAVSAATFLYDFGQNLSGRPHLVVEGQAGAKVRLTWSEITRGGQAFQDNIGWGYYEYTLRGAGREQWSPKFSYTGFRYLQVAGAVPAGAPNPSHLPVIRALSAEFLYPNVRTDGQFACSRPLLNQIHHLITAAILSNMKSVLTDCPTREKLGWLEEDHLVGPSIMDNYDAAALYGKVAQDIREAQTDAGLVPDIAPEYAVFGGPFRDSPEWGSACVISPWSVYLRYGDTKILKDNYGAMVRYVQYLTRKSNNGLLFYGLGDWRETTDTPNGVTATAIFYQDATILQKTAALLRHSEDSRRFAALAETIKAAFGRTFFHPDTNQYASGSQTADGMALALGLVEPARVPAVREHLIQDIRAHSDHTTSGEIGWPYVLRALEDAGHSDVIYAMATRTDNPSYGYQIVHGATTLTEDWDGPTRGDSQNHLMLGHLDDWFFRGLTGIQINMARPVGEQILFQPQIVAGLTWAAGSCRTVWGPVVSAWHRSGKRLFWHVTIPANAAATVLLPARSASDILEDALPVGRASGLTLLHREPGRVAYRIGSGDYHFTILSP